MGNHAIVVVAKEPIPVGNDLLSLFSTVYCRAGIALERFNSIRETHHHGRSDYLVGQTCVSQRSKFGSGFSGIYGFPSLCLRFDMPFLAFGRWDNAERAIGPLAWILQLLPQASQKCGQIY